MTALGRSIAATVATLACLAVTACSGGESPADGSEADRYPPGSPLEQALAYLPATTGTVSFLDQHLVEERTGLVDVEADSPERATQRWYRAMGEASGGQAGIRAYLTLMKDSAFSAADIEWEAEATTVSGGPTGAPGALLWRLSDDVDFEAVEADLADAGFRRDKEADLPTFRIDYGNVDDYGLVGGRYPAELWDVALVAEQRLVVSGHDLDEVLDVIGSGAESLADTGSFTPLLQQAGHLDRIEFAGLVRKEGCDLGRGLFTPSNQPLALVRLAPSGRAARKDAAQLPDGLASLGIDVTVTRKGRAVIAHAPFAQRLPLVEAWQGTVALLKCAET